MIVKKFLKGFMAAALAVTMAVMPVSSVKAAEVTVTSGHVRVHVNHVLLVQCVVQM